MAQHISNLVAGRSCDECNVCCDVPTINQPELKKLSGVLCPHCERGKGCTIYATRPAVCRDWHCEWRKTFSLGPEWRPDRSKVLIVETYDDIPPVFTRSGFKFELLGDSLQQILWPPLIARIAALVQKGIPIFLLVPGQPGYASGRVFLNANIDLQAAIASHNVERVANELTKAVQACIRQPKEKIELE